MLRVPLSILGESIGNLPTEDAGDDQGGYSEGPILGASLWPPSSSSAMKTNLKTETGRCAKPRLTPGLPLTYDLEYHPASAAAIRARQAICNMAPDAYDRLGKSPTSECSEFLSASWGESIGNLPTEDAGDDQGGHSEGPILGASLWPPSSSSAMKTNLKTETGRCAKPRLTPGLPLTYDLEYHPASAAAIRARQAICNMAPDAYDRLGKSPTSGCSEFLSAS